jgi:glycosyltransferase involved in cell wall biosynthesis
MTTDKAAFGGTELMYNELMSRLPDDIKEKYSIFTYPINADDTKPLIYWNHLSYDQSNVQFLQNPQLVDYIHHFVFVSHWQAEQYRKIFNIPGFKTTVIKNAHLGINKKQFSTNSPVKVCFTSTPWRGLDILLDAWEQLDVSNCELHVFSSTEIYGKEFMEQEDDKYKYLYERCNSLENVVYRGFIENEKLLEELPTFDILAYPCNFEETSCLSVIEALAAGLRVVTSNLGALPETTEGWATLYPFMTNPQLHAQKFKTLLQNEINNIRKTDVVKMLKQQQAAYNNKWSWDTRIHDWTNFFKTLGE